MGIVVLNKVFTHFKTQNWHCHHSANKAFLPWLAVTPLLPFKADTNRWFSFLLQSFLFNKPLLNTFIGLGNDTAIVIVTAKISEKSPSCLFDREFLDLCNGIFTLHVTGVPCWNTPCPLAPLPFAKIPWVSHKYVHKK